MRLKSLRFVRVGNVPGERTYTLGPGVNVVLGDNEAGKSTARRALEALLFGPTKALVDPPGIAAFECAATIDPDDGTAPVELHRRGRNLVSPAPAPLAALLAPGNAQRFHDLFGLDHENLRRDPSFLGAEGMIGSLLFGARTGLAPDLLSRLITDLGEAIDDAGGRRKGADGLRKRLDAYAIAKERRDAVARFEQYNEAVAAAERAQQELTEQQKNQRILQAEQATLVTLRDGLKPYEEWLGTRDRLERLSTPRPPATRAQAAALEQQRARLHDAEKALAAREREVGEARDALSRAPVASVLVSLLDELFALAARVGRVDGERDTLAKEQDEQKEKAADLARTVTSLGGEPGADVVAAALSLVRPTPVRAALQEAVDRHAELQRKLEDARANVQASERRAAEARRAADATPLVELLALTLARNEANTATGAEEAADQARQALAMHTRAAERAAKALGLSHLSPEERAAITRPDSDRAERVRKELDAATTAFERATQAESAARAELAAATRQRERLANGLVDVPDPTLLERTRLARDLKWQELQAFWTPTLRRGTEEALKSAAEEFETLLRAHDALFAQWAAAGESFAALQAAQRDEQRAAEVHASAQQAWTDARNAVTTHKATWSALWRFLPDPPESVSQWFTQFDRWTLALEQAADAEAKALKAEAVVAQHLANVRAHVGATHPAVLELASATAVEAYLDEALEESRRANKRAESLRTTADLKETALRDARDLLARLEDEFAAWEAGWKSLVTDLPAGIGARPAAVEDWLDHQKSLEDTARDLARLAARMAERRARIEAHDVATAALVSRARKLDPDLGIPTTLAPPDAFAALTSRAEKARADRDQREKAQDAYDRALKDHEAAQHTLGERRSAIDVGWAALGRTDPWTLESLDEEHRRAEEAESLRQQLAQAARAVDALWRPERATFVAALAGRTHADLEAALADVGARLEARSASVEEARTVALQARAAVDALDARHDALAVAQEYEQARDAVHAKADELLRLRVARLLLEEARRRATDGGSDLQAVASRHFATLTGGAWTGLRIDQDDDGGELLAVSDGDVRKVSELSTGTADQLWLALRLAAIEQAALETPLPLLLDDVFVQFDDARTSAALKVLAEVSAKVQVILFTHHDHLLDLARAAIPERLTAVVLPRPDGSARVRTLATERVPHDRPDLPEPDAPEAESPETAATRTRRPRGDTSEAEALVLDLLAGSDEPLGKSDLVEAAAARGQELEAVWGATIKALVDSGRVVKTGDRKGAKYSLATP